MKIALISPPFRGNIYFERGFMPLGILYLRSSLNSRGYDCDIYDFSTTLLSDEELIEKYDLLSYDVIGVSSFSTIFDKTVNLLSLLKKNDNVIVVGGHHISLAPQVVMMDFPFIDYGIIGYAENSFVCFLDMLKKQKVEDFPGLCRRDNSQVIVNPPDYLNYDLHNIPIIDRNNIIIDYDSKLCVNDDFFISISTSRGCPYKCTYCINCKNDYWLCREIDDIKKEIKELKNIRSFKHIFITDCNFLVNPKRALEILKVIHQILPKATVNFQTRSDQIVKYIDIIKEMKFYGCRSINVGIESNSRDVLKRYKKMTTPEINQKAISLLRETAIQPIAYIIMFEAMEKLEDIRNNFDFIKENNLDTESLVSNLYSCLRPFYGTDYYANFSSHYEENIHGISLPIFVDNKVRQLYEVMYDYRNFFEDKISYLNSIVRRREKNIIDTDIEACLSVLCKSHYMVFEYVLNQLENENDISYFQLCQSSLLKFIKNVLDYTINRFNIKMPEGL